MADLHVHNFILLDNLLRIDFVSFQFQLAVNIRLVSLDRNHLYVVLQRVLLRFFLQPLDRRPHSRDFLGQLEHPNVNAISDCIELLIDLGLVLALQTVVLGLLQA